MAQSTETSKLPKLSSSREDWFKVTQYESLLVVRTLFLGFKDFKLQTNKLHQQGHHSPVPSKAAEVAVGKKPYIFIEINKYKFCRLISYFVILQCNKVATSQTKSLHM